MLLWKMVRQMVAMKPSSSFVDKHIDLWQIRLLLRTNLVVFYEAGSIHAP